MKLKHLILFLAVVVAACSTRQDVPGVEEAETQSYASLQAIDSLMWRQPDSALMVLVDFAATPKADSLGAFDGHYCQLLLSELFFSLEEIKVLIYIMAKERMPMAIGFLQLAQWFIMQGTFVY